MPIIVFKILRLNKITNLVNLIRKDDNFKRSRRRNETKKWDFIGGKLIVWDMLKAKKLICSKRQVWSNISHDITRLL